MGKRKIDEWTLDYWLFQQYVTLFYRVFYRKLYVHNREVLPKGTPYIITPNHQNALMDALAIVCNTNLQCVFLARADIFKGRVVKHLLNFFNIMPIFRLRDGIENVKRNDEVFGKAIGVLKNKLNPVAIFPEGNHGKQHKLRPLVKGAFRMALKTHDDLEGREHVLIVPMGIEYSNYAKFRADKLIVFGEPIDVSAIVEVCPDDRVGAVKCLKEALERELSSVMVDIRNEKYYEMYMLLRKVCNTEIRLLAGIKGDTLYDRFRADKLMISALDEQYKANPEALVNLQPLVVEYVAGLEAAGIRDWVVRKGRFNLASEVLRALLLLLVSPLALAGVVGNYLPCWLSALPIKNIRDKQFHSSFKFVMGLVVFPVYYLVCGAAIALFTKGWTIPLIGIAMLPLSGYYSLHFVVHLKKTVARIRYMTTLKRNGIASSLKLKRDTILKIVNHICSKYF